MKHAINRNYEIDSYVVCDTVPGGYIEIEPRPSSRHKPSAAGWYIDISDARREAGTRIALSFQLAMATGSFVSAAVGIEVDCRRSDKNNDLQTVQALYSNMDRKGVAAVVYKGSREAVAGVTKQKIKDLQYEMEDYGLSLYQKKWQLEGEIEASTTVEQLDQIVW